MCSLKYIIPPKPANQDKCWRWWDWESVPCLILEAALRAVLFPTLQFYGPAQDVVWHGVRVSFPVHHHDPEDAGDGTSHLLERCLHLLLLRLDLLVTVAFGGGPGQSTHTKAPGLAIPDNAVAISDAITVPDPRTATSVSVAVDIAHPYIDDPTVELVAPDGTARTLRDRSGGNADDVEQTYTPNFGGTGIAGDWTLRVSDGASGDAGTLNGWTLTIDHDGAGGSVTGLAGSGNQYLVTVSAPQGGTYNLDVVQDSGITDAAGNPLADAAPTGADHTYTRIGL